MPPSVVKQRPGPGPARPGPARPAPAARAAPDPVIRAAPGSVLSKAIPASEIRDTWVKLLLYGPSGTGKTRLSGTFEKPLLFLALERTPSGGALTVRGMPGITVLRPGTRSPDPDREARFEDPIDGALFVEEMDRLAAELKAHNPFRTVVIDHVSVFQDYVLEKIVGRRLPEQIGFGTVSGDHYRDRAEATKQMLRPWVDLPCHTVFIGKEKDHNPPKQESVNPRTGKVQPDMRPRFIRGLQQESCVMVDLGGGSADWLVNACDYVCRLYMDREVTRVETEINGETVVDYQQTGRFVRALRVGYHPNYMARFRSDATDLPEAIINPTYEKIVAAIDGRYDGT